MTIKPSYGTPRNKTTFVTALISSVLIVLMLIAQMFAYEDFSIILSDITSLNDSQSLSVVASVIVLSELMSLPYLLGMYISRLLRVVSAGSAIGISGFWLLSSLTNAHSVNSALFSTSILLPGGLLAALWSFILFICVCRLVYADSRFRHVAPLR